MKGRQLRIPFVLFALLLLLVVMGGCNDTATRDLRKEATREAMRKELESSEMTIDTLINYLETARRNNEPALVLMYAQELGRRYREQSNFSMAIKYHTISLDEAIKQRDTLSIIYTYNSLGTDYRRVSLLSQASTYHYDALRMCYQYSDTSTFDARKNRVMALNGIGNIELALGNLKEAETLFLEALHQEKELDSPLGQAINYANLGSIYKKRNNLIKARTYFELSMEQNRIASNNLGLGLCFNHLGSLDEAEGNYRYAENNYYSAYQILSAKSDKWHWVNICVSLARIHLLQGEYSEYQRYLDLAEETAIQLESVKALAEIYDLKHRYSLMQKDYKGALLNYQTSRVYTDSLSKQESSSLVNEVRFNYERQQNSSALASLEADHNRQAREHKYVLYISLVAIVVLLTLLFTFLYAYRRGVSINKALREIDRMRSDFFAGITHEFRTPLTVILGMNEQLRDTSRATSASEKDKYHEVIQRQGATLLSLINQLLGIAKLRTGAALPEWRRGDVILFVKMLIEPFNTYAKENGVHLQLVALDDKLEIDFVPSYLQKILTNLLANAIRHTDEGDSIQLSLMRQDEHSIVIKVEDTGEGMSPEVQQRIFEAYYKQSGSGGIGIGLTFTRMLVEHLKGQISVESEEGIGTIFTVVLPCVLQQAEELPEWLPTSFAPAPTLVSGLSRQVPNDLPTPTPSVQDQPKILIVEDNKDVALLIKLLIADRYSVFFARNGQEAFTMAMGHMPDLILTDLMMPLMDGNELCRQVRASHLLRHIPIIVLSAKIAEEDRISSLKAGADLYVTKPFNPDELLLHIERLIGATALASKETPTEDLIASSTNTNRAYQKETDMAFITRVSQVVLDHCADAGFSAQTLAEKLSISHSQLNRKLTAIAGMSSSAYITKLRMRKAKSLLADPTKTIQEVSDLTGFSDRVYFSKVFRKAMGCTPRQYQQSALAEIKDNGIYPPPPDEPLNK